MSQTQSTKVGSNLSEVAIVTPTYNAQTYLSETIESLLGQTYSAFKLYILDGGSKDLTVEIANAFARRDSRIAVCEFPNTKPAARFNWALDRLFERFIVVSHADDISLPNRIEAQVDFMRLNQHCVLSGSQVNFWEHARSVADFSQPVGRLAFPLSHGEITARLPFWWCFCTPTIIMNREIVNRHALYIDTSFEAGADWVFYWQASKIGEVRNIDQTLLWRRFHSFSDGATHLNEIAAETAKLRSLIANETGLASGLSKAEKESFLNMRVEYDLIINMQHGLDYVALFSKVLENNKSSTYFSYQDLKNCLLSLKLAPISSIVHSSPIISYDQTYHVHAQAALNEKCLEIEKLNEQLALRQSELNSALDNVKELHEELQLRSTLLRKQAKFPSLWRRQT